MKQMRWHRRLEHTSCLGLRHGYVARLSKRGHERCWGAVVGVLRWWVCKARKIPTMGTLLIIPILLHIRPIRLLVSCELCLLSIHRLLRMIFILVRQISPRLLMPAPVRSSCRLYGQSACIGREGIHIVAWLMSSALPFVLLAAFRIVSSGIWSIAL